MKERKKTTQHLQNEILYLFIISDNLWQYGMHFAVKRRWYIISGGGFQMISFVAHEGGTVFAQVSMLF